MSKESRRARKFYFNEYIITPQRFADDTNAAVQEILEPPEAKYELRLARKTARNIKRFEFNRCRDAKINPKEQSGCEIGSLPKYLDVVIEGIEGGLAHIIFKSGGRNYSRYLPVVGSFIPKNVYPGALLRIFKYKDAGKDAFIATIIEPNDNGQELKVDMTLAERMEYAEKYKKK